MITLPNANFMFAGIDGAVHLAEDALNAATAVPWALISTITIGFITTFPFTVSLFYCITDPVAILESPVPIFGIFLQATGSDKGATAMTVFLLMTGFWALMATIQVSSAVRECVSGVLQTHRAMRNDRGGSEKLSRKWLSLVA